MVNGEEMQLLIVLFSLGVKNSINKLGQRQSQIPISSAFWFQQDFMSKKVRVHKNLGSKKLFGPKKFWV